MAGPKKPKVIKKAIKMLVKGNIADHPREKYISVECPGIIIFVRHETADALIEAGKAVKYGGKKGHLELEGLDSNEKAVAKSLKVEADTLLQKALLSVTVQPAQDVIDAAVKKALDAERAKK